MKDIGKSLMIDVKKNNRGVMLHVIQIIFRFGFRVYTTAAFSWSEIVLGTIAHMVLARERVAYADEITWAFRVQAIGVPCYSFTSRVNLARSEQSLRLQ